MTTYYVRSTDGNNADTGATWALAKADIAGFSAVDAAGDTAYVSQSHAESTNGNVTWAFAGTIPSPVRVICGDDSAEPPIALASNATINTTGLNRVFSITGSGYFYGFTISVGDSGAAPTLNFGGSRTWQQWENCSFRFSTGTTGGTMSVGGTTANTISQVHIWRNCTVRMSATGQRLAPTSGFFHWNGGGLAAGGTSPTNLLILQNVSNQAGVKVVIENCDFSAGSSSMNFTSSQPGYATTLVYRNCLLPSSWSGNFCGAFSADTQGRMEAYNCHDAAGHVNYKLKIIDGLGTIDHETTFVKAGGASDGTTPSSWKLTTNTAVAYPLSALFTPEILYWNEQVGIARTVTLDFLHDSVTGLTDADIWAEVTYPGSMSTPVNSVTISRAGLVSASSTLASSSSGWTTTGMANPNRQQVSVSFTPQAKGFITIKVYLAAASKTIYLDPLPAIS